MLRKKFPCGATQVAQQSKALHRSATCVTTDHGLTPGCIAANQKPHEAADNWPSVVLVTPVAGQAQCTLP